MAKYRKRITEVEAWKVGSDEPLPEWIEQVSRPYLFCGTEMVDVVTTCWPFSRSYLIGKYVVYEEDEYGNFKCDGLTEETFNRRYEVVVDGD